MNERSKMQNKYLASKSTVAIRRIHNRVSSDVLAPEAGSKNDLEK